MAVGSSRNHGCSSNSSSSSSNISNVWQARHPTQRPCKHAHQQRLAVHLLLLMAAATMLGQAAGGRQLSASSPKRKGCIVDTYEQLYNTTEDYSTCGGGDDAHIFLGCNTRLFTRGSLPPLHIAHDAPESSSHEPSVHILPESECGIITIEVDLEQNPQLPLLTVHGDLGIHKFELNNVRFIVKGANASAVMPVCTSRPCQATPLIDIHDVEHVTLINVTVTSQQPSQPNGVWHQLPYSGISIKTVAGGVPIINLDGVTAAKMVDGVRVVGGGNLAVHNMRSSRNHNMGLYYMCSMVQQSSLVVTGKTTIVGNGGLGVPVQEGEEERGVGIHIDCNGDFITLDASISGDVVIAGNMQHGILIDGHVHAEIGPGVKLHNNGGGNLTQCGGGVHAHFLYGSPAVKFQGVKFVNNSAQYGGGACIEVPEEAKPLVGKISGEFNLLSDVSFVRNKATVCGGAFASVVSPAKSRVKVLVPDGVGHTFYNNTAPNAPVWCAMSVYGNDFMAITL